MIITKSKSAAQSKLHKLESMGSQTNCLCGSCRKTAGCVVLNNILSSWITVISGVPQGSVLGHLLFVILVDDINRIVKSDTFIC